LQTNEAVHLERVHGRQELVLAGLDKPNIGSPCMAPYASRQIVRPHHGCGTGGKVRHVDSTGGD
jgi:hypothetical protein